MDIRLLIIGTGLALFLLIGLFVLIMNRLDNQGN